ncbi:NfeD family protein [Flexibacterium corallicola]|uniref:NfeD family protein n=1 Tax=Flexibacterium corallicola TaxID=3037259 RepID=UPI00286F7D7C|nr:NfeD family protein [Pseudovibrio sp. M1P-2-3]
MSALIDLVNMLGPWKWWVLGLLLLGLEVAAPGWIFVWFGLAAFIVGGVALFVELSWQWSLGLFLAASVVSLVLGRSFMMKITRTQGDPELNQRGSRYLGREFVLADPIQNGQGTLHIDGTIWRISGDDTSVGTKVKIVEIEGVSLKVQKVT